MANEQKERVVRPDGVQGVLVIDKPEGPTSHDVVQQLRRVLQERRVGHAGTLDPMATGVLIVALGGATKLVPYLTAHAKRYRLVLRFGYSTDTLDRCGKPTETRPIPAELAKQAAPLLGHEWVLDTPRARPRSALADALFTELERQEQVPPAFSAIQVAGERAYELARRGAAPLLPPRPVGLRAFSLLAASDDSLTLELATTKGYYVRSFVRDLAICLNTAATLTVLRRLSSGPFELAESMPLPSTRTSLLQALVSLEAAARRALPSATLCDEGVLRARQGKHLLPDHFLQRPPACGAWFSTAGELVAVGEWNPGDTYSVRRGFCGAPLSTLEEGPPPV